MYLAGVRLKAERDAARLVDEQRWRERVIVSDTRTHFHRLNPQTELSERGLRSANQVSRLTGMLKSAPRKHTLLNPPTAIVDINPLGVVNNPTVDFTERQFGRTPRPATEGDERVRGLKAGPYVERRWQMNDNHVPALDYEHDKFKQRKGADFK